MRKTKRKLITYDTAGFKDDFTAKSVLLRRQRENYLDFANQAGLKTLLKNAGVYGYNRSTSSKSVWASEKHHQAWLDKINAKSTALNTVKKYHAARLENAEEYRLLKAFSSSRQTNIISNWTSFSDYQKYSDVVQRNLVGKTTSDGVELNGYTNHFMERIFGTDRDPGTGRPRSGVDPSEVLQALMNPIEIKPDKISSNGQKSRVYVGETLKVSVNPQTGILIQTNPYIRRQK